MPCRSTPAGRAARRAAWTIVLPLALAAAAAAHSPFAIAAPIDVASALAESLARAGDNRAELDKALAALEGDERASMEFLVANMPDRDLASLTAELLIENVRLAHEAMASSPWGAAIPREIFLDNVLPYANVNERRDRWRPRLAATCRPLIEGCKTPSEAAQRLNETLFKEVGVKYSTARRRADQGPFESMESGLASCTGLSILLVDACRAVGVPARVVGTPNWANKRGNHTWVEIWDGRWRFTGACEPDARGLDHAWFERDAAQAIEDSEQHAIYAVSFRKTGTRFPLVWARGARDVNAVNVTSRYAKAPEAAAAPAGVRLLIDVLDAPGGKRVAARVEVVDVADASKVLSGTSRDTAADTNDILSFDVAPRAVCEIRARLGERRAVERREIGASGEVTVRLVLAAPPEAPAPLGEDARAALRAAFDRYFAAAAEERDRVEFDAALPPLVASHEDEVRALAWESYRAAPMHAAAREDFDNRRVRWRENESPYTAKSVGERPAGGWALFIAMHGGGGVAKRVNDQQWRVMQSYYRDQASVPGYIYVALRAPNDTWNGFYDDYVYPLIANLVRQHLLFGDVDPDKVFLMGYSHGGYGAFAIGPKIPHRFAAIHASAAAPTDGETTPKTLRNTVFTYMIGERDLAYGRLPRCQAFDAAVRELRGDRDDIYPVTMEFQAGHGHGGLPDRDKIRDMIASTRRPAPREIVWAMTDSVVTDFFWLETTRPGKGREVEARCDDNRIDLDMKGIEDLSILLDARLVDFSRPVTVQTGDGVVEHRVRPSLRTLCETLLARGDPRLAFTARIRLGSF